MRARYKHHVPIAILRIAAGIVFIILGLAGLVLPVLQGILFLAIGALLLSPFIPFFRRMKIGMYRKFPTIRHVIERTKKRLKARFHKNHYIDLDTPSGKK